ncbi:efflux RND transporter permease subunit [Gluconobacter sphaericus]|uniref:efflux RND transporter permease subunit n=1 Tax=Gluconobacter sphaericus TaxID=574987 RepID=UPI002012BDDB|nr:efflux RND transporter permease subunit [Gluconobacter sphaericus]
MLMKYGNSSRTEKSETTERQRFLLRDATLAAASFGLATGSADSASAQERTINLGSSRVHAYRSAGDHAPFQAIEIPRRAMGPHDVLPDILYCGVCHSDIHTARGEWGPMPRPCISGHEIIGRVIGAGSKVTKFRADDIGGAECIVDFRPIIMTTATMVVGLASLVIAKSVGANSRSELVIVIIVSMIVNTTMTLFVLPSVYTVIRPRRSKRV